MRSKSSRLGRTAGASLASFALLVAACSANLDDPAGGEDDVELNAGARATVRVVQLNPYYAGRLAPADVTGGSCSRSTDCARTDRTVCSAGSADGCWECIDKKCRQRTWETITHAARLVSAIDAQVIGIEELKPEFTSGIDEILESKTGVEWDELVTPQGIGGKSSGVGIFWRRDRIELVADLGYVDVDTLSTGYLVRYRGAILRHGASRKMFGFFAGKLFWEHGQSARRKSEAERLRAWMDAEMAPWEARGVRARILASDFNDTVDSSPYDVFASYDDGDARKNTVPGKNPDSFFAFGRRRIDYLFWADGPGGASIDGFTTEQSDGRLGRSEYFGSDHRFIYGDARVP